MAKWNESQNRLARLWYTQALGSEQLHIAAHHRYGRLNFLVGIPVVVVTATTGTAFFASLGKSLDIRVSVAFGLISIMSSVLAALQTFLRFAERSEQHRISAARYRIAAREIEQVLAMPTTERGDPVSLMEAWGKEFASLAENSPAVPPLKGGSDLLLYPEGTACAAVLRATERGGSVSRLLARWRFERQRSQLIKTTTQEVVESPQGQRTIGRNAEPGA